MPVFPFCWPPQHIFFGVRTPFHDGVAHRVSQDYTATGAVEGTRALTLLQLYLSRSHDTARHLILAAKSPKNADHIDISGHTDAQVARPRDAKITLGRAQAARNFLVNNGVVAEKINVFSQADGGFIAPNITKGRALNRRVEIEFFG